MPGAAGKLLSGWQLNGILALADGTPVAINTGFNRSRNGASGGQIGDRPDLQSFEWAGRFFRHDSKHAHGFTPDPVWPEVHLLTGPGATWSSWIGGPGCSTQRIP